MIKKIVIFLAVATSLLLFFSYKLTTVPTGITVDEGAFGYNAILLSRTLHDENGRFLPMFVLSIGGTDWRQPVTQYVDVVFFKIFGASVFNLRFTSVIVALISVFLIFYLSRKLLGTRGGIVASLILITTPIFMIQSHLGLDNIYPTPFVIGWLFSLLLFEKTKNRNWLILSAICLGIGYYTYKGMRVFVPTWAVLTCLYLAKDFLFKRTQKIFLEIVKPVLTFSISLLPFFAIIPVLEYYYSGAVLDHTHYVFEGVYKLLYPVFSSFDPSFLFIKGDDILIHSTGWHGMFLLMSLPFFLAGLTAWKKNYFWKLIIISLFLGPLLFGVANSVHRASRMLAEIPMYSLISAAGFLWFWEKKKVFWLGVLIILFALNYFDFLHYYWGNYASDTENLFYNYTYWEGGYKTLSEESRQLNLAPYADQKFSKAGDTTKDFMRSIYFVKPPQVWNGDVNSLPKNSILMTDNEKLTTLKRIASYKNLIYYENN